jgi:hypothetical protein
LIVGHVELGGGGGHLRNRGKPVGVPNLLVERCLRRDGSTITQDCGLVVKFLQSIRACAHDVG